MTNREFQRILEQIAKLNHTTPEYVQKEMQLAMEEGQKSSNPAIRANWNAIPRKNNELTLEEFVEYIAKKVKYP